MIVGVLVLAVTQQAASQGAHTGHGAGPDAAAMTQGPRSERALARYPQPVLVSALINRPFLENSQRQTVLGRVAGVLRDEAGQVLLLVDRTGFLGLGAVQVAVPARATALLGQFVVLMDLDAGQWAALPAAATTLGRPLPVEASVEIGLTRN